MNTVKSRQLRGVGLAALALLLLLSAVLPAAAGDTGWSIGLGLNGGTASPDSNSAQDIDLGGIALFGRWQHSNTGWGAMAEIRAGEDDESFTEFDYGQIVLSGTYTWRRDKLARPFVKFGVSNTEVEISGGNADNDTAGIFGGGIEVGRGHWAFHFSIDGTAPKIDVIDAQKRTAFGSSTVGATYRF